MDISLAYYTSPMKKIFFLALFATLFSSCNFLSTSNSYRKTATAFVDALIKEDYDAAMVCMAMDHELAKDINREQFKLGLMDLRQIIVRNFGTDVSIDLVHAKQTITIDAKEKDNGMFPIVISLSNENVYGLANVVYDKRSGKIFNFNMFKIGQPMPSRLLFFAVAIVFFSVLVFNVWVIVRIVKSDMRRKWLKILAILVLNLPTIEFSPITGFLFKAGHFHLFGFGFTYISFLGSTLAVGIPVAGIYWLWRLNIHRRRRAEYDELANMYNTGEVQGTVVQ